MKARCHLLNQKRLNKRCTILKVLLRLKLTLGQLGKGHQVLKGMIRFKASLKIKLQSLKVMIVHLTGKILVLKRLDQQVLRSLLLRVRLKV